MQHEASEGSTTASGSLLNLGSMSYWETGTDHRFTTLVVPGRPGDPGAELLLGKTRWEIPGAVALTMTWEAFRALLDAHQPFQDFYYVVFPPGEAPVYFCSSGEPMWQGGQFVGYRGAGRNVTQEWLVRRRAEDAERLLSVAARLSRFGAWSVDTATGAFTCSAQAGDISGVPLGDVSDLQQLLQLFTPESRRRLREAYDCCAMQGTPFELDLTASVGTRSLWLRISGVPVQDEAGRVLRVEGAFQDVTETTSVLEQNRAMARRLEDILNRLPDGFGTITRSWRITYANPAAEHVLGLPRSQLVGRVLWEVFPGLEATEFGRMYMRVMSQREEETLEAYYEPLERWLRVRAFPSDEGMGIAFADVSEARTTRQELQALTTAHADLQSFSYTLAHDLRAPLAVMSGFAGFIERSDEQQLGPRSARYLARIQAAGRQMNDIIDGIVGLANLSRAPMREEEVDLSALATEAAQTLAATSPERQVQWRIAPGLIALGDPAMLSVAITNLLSNAWKYTRPVAEPVIEVGRAEGAGGASTFFVRDNGVGFDAAQAPRLFQPFCRMHGDEFEGTGIGLATVHRVMARHRGSVWADSAPGRGATFCFSLPRQARTVL